MVFLVHCFAVIVAFRQRIIAVGISADVNKTSRYAVDAHGEVESASKVDMSASAPATVIRSVQKADKSKAKLAESNSTLRMYTVLGGVSRSSLDARKAANLTSTMQTYIYTMSTAGCLAPPDHCDRDNNLTVSYNIAKSMTPAMTSITVEEETSTGATILRMKSTVPPPGDAYLVRVWLNQEKTRSLPVVLNEMLMELSITGNGTIFVSDIEGGVPPLETQSQSSSNGPSCLPGDSRVYVAGAGSVDVKAIREGDDVAVAGGLHEPVLGFVHMLGATEPENEPLRQTVFAK